MHFAGGRACQARVAYCTRVAKVWEVWCSLGRRNKATEEIVAADRPVTNELGDYEFE